MPSWSPFASPSTTASCHTSTRSTHSDGNYTPAQVVDLARRSGLSAVAITDHDTTSGLEAARQAVGTSTTPEIIAGVEITAEFRGRELHLLAYFFHPEDRPLQAA